MLNFLQIFIYLVAVRILLHKSVVGQMRETGVSILGVSGLCCSAIFCLTCDAVGQDREKGKILYKFYALCSARKCKRVI